MDANFMGRLLAEVLGIVEGWADRAVMGDMQIGGLRKFQKILCGHRENRAGLAIKCFCDGGPDGKVDVGLHENDPCGCGAKSYGLCKAAGCAARSTAFQHHEDLAIEALASLRVVNVDNDSAAGIESAPEAQGFIEQKHRALGNAWVEHGHVRNHKAGSRQTSPLTALSTHSFKLPKQTLTPSMPGA